MSYKILITTPTGNVGSKVASRLVEKPGVELVLLVCDPARNFASTTPATLQEFGRTVVGPALRVAEAA